MQEKMIHLKVLATALALVAYFGFFCSKSAAEVIVHTIPDDGYAHVPLQFPFPYYGQVFTESFMFDNGVVGFMDPSTGFDGGRDFVSRPLDGNLTPRFSFMIAPLWTDLINYGSGRFESEGTDQYQQYRWVDISQWGRPNNLNTFSLEIDPQGGIFIDYEKINLDWLGSPTSIGLTGDVTQGEYDQILFSSGVPLNTNSVSNWGTITEVDYCSSDPLYDPSCPGYAQAFFDMQCLISPLYDTTCPGYEQTFFNLQCVISPLYDSTCPGYEQAFFDMQCLGDPLYDPSCSGYEQAFFDAQCSNDPLYDSTCPGYEQAFFDDQKEKACQANPQISSDCSGYVEPTAASASNNAPTVATDVPSVIISNTGTIDVGVPLVSDPVVNSQLQSSETVSSNEPETASLAAVETTVTAPPVVSARQQEQQAQEQQKSRSEINRMERRSSGNREQARKEATERAKDLANEISEATTLEAQTENQALVLDLINYATNFSAYENIILPDGFFYSDRAYRDSVIPDNWNAQRRMNAASDYKHQLMIDSQYQ